MELELDHFNVEWINTSMDVFPHAVNFQCCVIPIYWFTDEISQMTIPRSCLKKKNPRLVTENLAFCFNIYTVCSPKIPGVLQQILPRNVFLARSGLECQSGREGEYEFPGPDCAVGVLRDGFQFLLKVKGSLRTSSPLIEYRL